MRRNWSIEARDIEDKKWQVCSYNVPPWKVIVKAVACITKYEVVHIERHGRKQKCL